MRADETALVRRWVVEVALNELHSRPSHFWEAGGRIGSAATDQHRAPRHHGSRETNESVEAHRSSIEHTQMLTRSRRRCSRTRSHHRHGPPYAWRHSLWLAALSGLRVTP